jgi:hypothetical protein
LTGGGARLTNVAADKGVTVTTLQRLLLVGIFVTVPSLAKAQGAPDGVFRRHFVGSSAFVMANLMPDPPSFYQLNYGYWLTKGDVLSLEAITWTYDAPLGIPYGPSKGSPDEAYPGYVRAYGVGLAYQRFLWKDSYSAIHAAPMFQKYIDEQNEKIQNGFQLFLTLRLGYHIRLFSDRFFMEPSVAFTHWPINTNLPESFRARESRWPNYFLFEPGLHLGFKR